MPESGGITLNNDIDVSATVEEEKWGEGVEGREEGVGGEGGGVVEEEEEAIHAKTIVIRIQYEQLK